MLLDDHKSQTSAECNSEVSEPKILFILSRGILIVSHNIVTIQSQSYDIIEWQYVLP